MTRLSTLLLAALALLCLAADTPQRFDIVDFWPGSVR